MVQWLRICLAIQETPVQSLVWEDPACHGATRPKHHNGLEPELHNKRSHHNKRPEHPNQGVACVQQWRPRAARSQ